MNKTWIVIKREYITRVRKKSFIILTLLVPLLFATLMVLPALMMQFDTGTDSVLVLDESGLEGGVKIENISAINFAYQNTGNVDELKDTFKAEGFNGFLYIPKLNIDRPLGIRYYSQTQAGVRVINYIEKKLKKIIEKHRFEKHGYDVEKINNLWVKLDIENVIISKEGEKTGNTIIAVAISQILGFTLYFALFMYGTMIMKGVIEEKKNRIIEVMISSIKPFQLMMGKIIGITAVALTQLIIWVVLVSIATTFIGGFIDTKAAEMPESKMANVHEIWTALQALDHGFIIFSFFVFFLFGYLMYSSMFAAVGSVAGEQQENQAITLPVTLPVIISMLIMMNIVRQPHSPLAFWSSMFPLFSPIVMTARLPFGVPTWQVALSMGILIMSFIFATWLSARIYRVGILMYGKKVTLKELFKWMFVKE